MPLPISYYYRLRQGESPATFASSGCLHPFRLRVYDSMTASTRWLDVDCGHCINCQRDIRNQWVTRMCLHSLSNRHCYFVTLTYGSYSLHDFVNHPFKDDWLDTFPVLDDHNTKKQLAWTPSILCKSHLAKFFKRLRFDTGADITYCACGEYGEHYGRPHFHCVIWSDKAISLDDIRHAWSYKCVKKDKYDIRRYTGNNDAWFYFRIGRVYMTDLVANGTLDWKAQFDGTEYSAAHCFQYVAKYLRKQQVANDIVKERLWRVYTMLPYDENIFNPDEASRLLAVEKANAYCTGKTTDYYEEKDSYIYHCFTYNHIHYEKILYPLFEKIVGPFFLCSRGKPIAKQYALENLRRFETGNFALPEFQGRTLSFPNYFHRLARFKEYPVCFEKSCICGTSFVKGVLPNVYAFFSALREDVSAWYSVQSFGLYKNTYSGRANSSLDTIYSKQLKPDTADIVLKDAKDGILRYRFSPISDVFLGFRYNRSTREYEFFEYCDRIDFCEWILGLLDKQYKKLPYVQEQQQMRLDLYDCMREDVEVDDKRQQYIKLCEDRQRFYYVKHNKKSDLQ